MMSFKIFYLNHEYLIQEVSLEAAIRAIQTKLNNKFRQTGSKLRIAGCDLSGMRI